MDNARYQSWQEVKKWIYQHSNHSKSEIYQSLLHDKDMLLDRLNLYFGIPKEVGEKEFADLHEHLATKYDHQ